MGKGNDHSQLTYGGDAIGAGSFGNIFYGQYKGAPVAVKIPNINDEEKDALIENERRIFRRINNQSPYIIGVHLDALGPERSLVMDFAEGGDLAGVITGNIGKNDWSYNYRLARDIAFGLDFLHKNGIIHRDLNPYNVLLAKRENGRPVEPKIADFGISATLGDAKKYKESLGVTDYLAPEVLKDRANISFASDIYSLAILLFCLADRVAPYATEDSSIIRRLVLIEAARPEYSKGEKDNHVPVKLKSLIADAWRSESAQRPNAAQIAVNLGTLLLDANDENINSNIVRKGKQYG